MIPTQLGPHFINTRYFRKTALDFKKNGGKYTLAPKYSKDWWEFWEEEERRCKYGISHGGVKITGKHYGYLNFSQMKRVSEDDKGKKVANKEPDFPSFWEIDYDWWWYKEIAWHGCNKERLDKLKLWKNPSPNDDGNYGGAKHLGCLKVRRGGFSYKEAWDAVHNFHLIPGSKSYFFAAIEQYLITDGILNKVEEDLNFINEHTDGFWLKHRMEKGVLMHQRATYKDSSGATMGTGSEIIGVIINDYNKVRGKDGVKISYEEAGSFPDLKAALAISTPSVTDGATLTGQISIFGTGGEEKGDHLEGLEEIFENPRLFDILAFENDWEEGYEGTECGVFIPCTMANPSFMDGEGNVNLKQSEEWEDKIREVKKSSKDSKDYDRRIAEYPKVPSEALLRVSNNNFPQAEVLLQYNRIMKSRELRGRMLNGEVKNDPTKGPDFFLKENAKPLNRYPHKNDEDLRSCVTMLERPQMAEYIDSNGLKKYGVPPDVYLLIVDPFYKDDPKDKTSLGAVYVCKQKSRYFQNICDYDVCWYVGRPNRAEDFYQIVLDLADFYNGKIQCEIAGGGKGLQDYAKARHKLNRLCFQPVYINGKEIEKIDKNRTYFMDISTDDKRLGIIYYADWIKTVIGLDDNGHEVWNLHYIYDLGLLQEIRKFSDEGNFDRISAQVLKMFMLKERREEMIKKKEKKPGGVFGHRKLFPDATSNNRVPLINIDGQFSK